MTHDHDPNPICATCYGALTDRPDNQFFCPGCAEYARNTGTIPPHEPRHPAFTDLVADNPSILEGKALTAQSAIHNEPDEYYGQIVEATAEHVRTHQDEVYVAGSFAERELTIPLDEFLSVLWTPDRPGRTTIPDGNLLYLE